MLQYWTGVTLGLVVVILTGLLCCFLFYWRQNKEEEEEEERRQHRLGQEGRLYRNRGYTDMERSACCTAARHHAADVQVPALAGGQQPGRVRGSGQPGIKQVRPRVSHHS